MITHKEQNRMMDYLVGKLQESYEVVTPHRKILNEDVSGILLNHDSGHCYGLIVLVDKEYPNDEFRKIYTKLHTEAQGTDIDIGLVFYKNHETFFRPAAPHCYTYNKHLRENVKKKPLVHYKPEDIHKMIMFRPEEIFAFKYRGRTIQYYQPESERLKEGLVTYGFDMVRPDYSYRDPDSFQPHIDAYKRDHIWKQHTFHDGNLFLEKRLLVPRIEPSSPEQNERE